MAQVGIIGLGLLGAAISERLVAAGNTVVGFDLSAACVQRFKAAGGTPAASPIEVAKQCGVVLLSLPDSKVVATVVDGLAKCLRSGQRIIDTSTGEPREAEAIA